MGENFDETALMTRITDLEQQLARPKAKSIYWRLTQAYVSSAVLPLFPIGGILFLCHLTGIAASQLVVWTYGLSVCVTALGIVVMSDDTHAALDFQVRPVVS